MAEKTAYMPPLPEMGHSEGYYTKRVHRAEQMGDLHARAAYKVGQYITLACAPRLTWAQRLRYFQHTLDHHCQPPHMPTEEAWSFYQSLGDLVRRYAGQMAIQHAQDENETFGKRLAMGQQRQAIVAEAVRFFQSVMPGFKCPHWLNREDFERLNRLRQRWAPAPEL